MNGELKKRIKNSWIRFSLFFDESSEQEKINLAKEAFLWAVARFDGFVVNSNRVMVKKGDILDEIVRVCPQIRETLTEEDIMSAFYFFCRESAKRGRMVSFQEVSWSRKFLTRKENLFKVEKLSYLSHIRSRGHRDFELLEWTIAEEEKKKLAVRVINDVEVSLRIKVNIAKEFELSCYQDLLMLYFKYLMSKGYFEEARELEVSNPEFIFELIVYSIDTGCFDTAQRIAGLFFPEDRRLAEEISEILQACISKLP